jgi:DNA-binding SARP family transcriptional activator/TolB-like protein
VIAQPKRLALLAYLAAAAPRGFQRRDTVLALFWPELGDEDARRALRQALHFLRREIGTDAIQTRGDEVGVNADFVWCDAVAFADALEAGSVADALTLYRGDLLDGLHVSDASAELEHWIGEQRDRLRRLAADAAWRLSNQADAAGNGVDAAHWARRGAALAPDDEGALRQLIRLLDRMGDRAGALRAYCDFAQRLTTELDAEPSAETKALVRAVRAREQTTVTNDEEPATLNPFPIAQPDRIAAGVMPPHDVASSPALRTKRLAVSLIGGWRFGVIAGAVFLVVVTVAYNRFSRSPNTSSLLAVGEIRAANGSDSSQLARSLPELLATDLARVSGLRVVSRARLYEILSQLAGDGRRQPTFTDAARQAGAREVLEGTLYSRAPEKLVLDLRRVDARTGVVRQAYRVEGAELFALADNATRAITEPMHLAPPTEPITAVTTTNLVARRLYEEGLRAYYYRDDLRTADRLFTSALGEDSTFAMAAYYSVRSSELDDLPLAYARLERALHTLTHASEHDRLLIEQLWAEFNNDPRELVLAESLAVRYPSEPDGDLALGKAMRDAGDFLGAVVHLRRVVSSDSLSLRGVGPRCRACDAYSIIVDAYQRADSLGAAERAAREWQAAQPHSPLAWFVLSRLLSSRNRPEALEAHRRAVALEPGVIDEADALAEMAIREGRFADADRALNARIQNAAPEASAEALWWLIVSLRNQGRERAALVAARRLVRVRSAGDTMTNLAARYSALLTEGQVLLEMGRPRDAVSIVAPLADTRWLGTRQSPGSRARHKAWTLTHAGTAAAAFADTVRLAAVADSVEVAGRLSAYGRDQRLHHHLRGLLLLARRRPDDAVSEFRHAIYSPTSGYTRTNLELGRLLVEQRKWDDAIAVLAPALRGPLDASNLYASRTEIEEGLARAFDGAGRADSAIVYYRRVSDAWSAGDEPFRARSGAARRRAASLGK